MTSYLVSTLQKMKQASADFVSHAGGYATLTAAEGGPEKAWASKQAEVKALVEKMQGDYKAMDSYGYETVEGIVAGVERFAKYDVYLPISNAPEKTPEQEAGLQPPSLDDGSQTPAASGSAPAPAGTAAAPAAAASAGK